MADGYGSAAGEFRALQNSLTLNEATRSCQNLVDAISRHGYGPATMPAVLEALDRLAEAADRDLRVTDELSEKRLKRISEVFDANETAIKDACDAATRDADAELMQTRSELEAEKERLEKKLSTAQEELRIGKDRGRQALVDEANRTIEVVLSSKQSLAKTLNDAEDLCGRRKSAAKEDRERRLKGNTQECNAARKECQRLTTELKNEIDRRCATPVNGLVPSGAYKIAREKANKLQVDITRPSMRKIDGYRRPPFFLVGSVMLPATRSTTYGGRSVFDHVPREAFCSAPDGTRSIRMPLVRDLARGLRIVLKSTEASADTTCAILRSLTLRLLLAYPPTALNVALIDPVRAGKTFSGLRRIVDTSHENILPEIAVTQESIRSLLKSLVDRMTQHLGNHSDPIRDGFFSLQAVQAIVINDFPYGFDKGSLSDLAKIMVNGEGIGTIVLLSVNQNYVKDVADNPDYRAIVGARGAYVLSGSDNWFSREGQRLYVRIGEVDKIVHAEGKILDALHDGICGAAGRVLTFEEMFGAADDQNAWHRESSIRGVEMPIGITGGNQRAIVSVGQPNGTSHHGLIGGITGAGKSSLLHTMIMSTLLSYSAKEVQLVLIDFKEGDEFAPFARWDLPAIRSVTTTTKPELALAALEDVYQEWLYRSNQDQRMDDYGRWRRANPDKVMPRWLVIFDEVQELLLPTTPPEVRQRCLDIMGTLTREGRSHGIHLFLASQSFESLGDIMALSPNMGCRIALDVGTGILRDDSALRNTQVGSAILNERGGASAEGNQLIRVALLNKDRELELLGRLQQIYDDPALRASLPQSPTRLYYSALTDNPAHPLCRLLSGIAPERYEGTAPRVSPGYVLSEPGVENAYEPTGETYRLTLSHNLLIVGGDPALATRILVNLALSLSNDDVARQAGGVYGSDRVVLGTFQAPNGRFGRRYHDEGRDVAVTDLDTLPCVRRASGLPLDEDPTTHRTPFEDAVNLMHDELERRRAEGFDGRGCYVLVIYGLGFAAEALAANLQALGGMGAPTLLEKVQDLIHDGPSLGIQVVVWAETLSDVNGVLDKGTQRVTKDQFGARIAFGRPADELRELTGRSEGPSTRGSFIIYDRSDGRRFFVAPFDLPKEKPGEWVKRFGKVCSKLRADRSKQAPKPW